MITAQIDLREFNLAMQQISALSKREMRDVVNDNMADLCLTAAKFPPKANRGEITSVQAKKWWPAFIHKVITGGGFVLRFQKRIPKAQQQSYSYRDPINGKMMRGQKTKSEFRKIDKIERKALRSLFTGKFKGVRDANAARVSNTIIKRRASRIGAMRAYLGLAAARFERVSSRSGRVRKFALHMYRRHLKGIQTIPATAAQAVSSAEAIWTFSNNKAPWRNSSKSPHGRPSPSQDVTKKQSMIVSALNKALPIVTARLQHAIDVKLSRIAKKHSATGAAFVRGFR